MKRLLMMLLCASACLTLRAEAFPPEALPTTWLAGERPTAWAQDELYLIECWATWCKPCIRAMPHMEALHQATKDQGVHVIGVSIDYGRTPDSLLKFLAGQPTPPTYAQAADPNGEVLQKKIAINAVPFAFAVRNGEIVWKGHPNGLTTEKLLALRKGEEVSEVKTRRAPAPNALRAEEEAIDALGWQDLGAALERQRAQILALPYQDYLSAPYVPAGSPVRGPYAQPAAPTEWSDAGDLAPYAKAFGRVLPADDALTVLSCQAAPGYGRDRPTYSFYFLLPGVMEAQAVQQPHRIFYITDSTSRERLEPFWNLLDDPYPALTYCDNLQMQELFGLSNQARPPYIAVFRKGTLLWKGPAEFAPEALRLTGLSVEEHRVAIQAEQARYDAHLELLKQLFDAKGAEATAKCFNAMKDEQLSSGIASMIVPNFFTEAYRQQDVQAGVAIYRTLLERFRGQSNALTMLTKMCDSWPELREPVLPELAKTWATIAELTLPYDPINAEQAFGVAAKVASDAGQKELAQVYARQAIEASTANLRYQQLSKGIPAMPTR